MDETTSIAELLERRDALETRMKELKIPEESIPALMKMLPEWQEIQDGMFSARERQFFNDAITIQAMNSGRGSTAKIAAQLRRFAEYIAQWVSGKEDVTDFVDGIPSMEPDK